MDRKGKKKAKNQKKLDLKRRYKEAHSEEFPTSSKRENKPESDLGKEMMRLFLSSTNDSIDAHSSLMSYFDRFELYKDKLNQVDSVRRDVHIVTVRSIISRFRDSIHFFELLCCDMVMRYFPRQFTKNERQKCYDLLVKDLHRHHPFCKIRDGNLINGNI